MTPIKLLTVPEAARLLRVSSQTLRRRVKRLGVVPDAILEEGQARLRTPLFVAPRLAELRKAINTQPELAA